MHTVGLLGHTGRIGSHALKHLVLAHQSGNITLIVLHRPASNIASVPEGIETRVLDLKNGDEEQIKKSVKGLQVLISATGMHGIPDQRKLIKPLSETPGFVTYMPPAFGPSWPLPKELIRDETERDAWDTRFDPRNRVYTAKFLGPMEEIKEYGVGVTFLNCGLFEEAFFDWALLGTDVQRNIVNLYEGAMDRPIYLVTPDGLGRAIAQVASRPPKTIVNELFHFYDIIATGRDIISSFTRINKSEPRVVPYTEAEVETALASGGMRITAAMYRRQWGKGYWGWQGERVGAQWSAGYERDQEYLDRLVTKYKTEGMSVLGRYWFLIKMVLGW